MKFKCSMGFESEICFASFIFLLYLSDFLNWEGNVTSVKMLKPQRELLNLASSSKIQMEIHNGNGRLSPKIFPGVEGTRKIRSIELYTSHVVVTTASISSAQSVFINCSFLEIAIYVNISLLRLRTCQHPKSHWI